MVNQNSGIFRNTLQPPQPINAVRSPDTILIVRATTKRDTSADKYSGLVTALAVLVAVVYAEERYDVWHAFLGIVGFILTWKYRCNLSNDDRFYTFLISSLFGISTVAIVYAIIERWQWLRGLIMNTFLTSSFTSFMIVTVIAFSLLFLKSKRRQP